MCISGVVNGSTTTYTLQSIGKADLGWMAMGFGSTMANTPMVIMWPNSDGSITLSQRMAPQEVMPTVVANPPRVATADPSASDLTGSTPKMTFTIPSDGSTSQNIIWAFGTINPDDSAVDATLQQHLDSGPTKIDLSQSLSSNSTSNQNPVTDPNASTGSVFPPLQPFQKMIIAHALLCTIGFLILLPAGGLLARYARTFTNIWFTGHWIFQFGLAGPVIVAGVGLGIGAVSKAGAPHLNDDHKKWGVAIFVLYFAQLVLGAIIHWVKPTSWTVGRRRPLQNYLHAIFGILIVGLAFYQVRSGYHSEWPTTSGRPPIDNGANIVWCVWVVLVPVLYIAGLAFLPRQIRQERPHKQAPSDEFTMREREYQPRYSD
ncbi:CBD9-like protein [Trametes sanguinea]|nr:CBD9-like protein [Trametes sanguinea]